MTSYTLPSSRRFCRDMQTAGLAVEHYHGRHFWEGPAVRVDDLQDALSETRVPCQWDNMGRGWIVYPRQADAGVGGPARVSTLTVRAEGAEVSVTAATQDEAVRLLLAGEDAR